MKRLFILTGILFQFLIIKGQVNIDFSKGFIIKNNRDTIFGELKQEPYSEMSSKVPFIAASGSSIINFTPNDLFGFYLQPNTYFESIKINLAKEKDTITSNYFALKIISGAIDFLIVYLPDGGEKYFVRSKVLGITELQQLTEIRGNQKFIDNKYILTLAKYMYNNLKFQTRIRNCSFHQNSIINLISDYNSALGANTLTLPPNKLNLDIYINAGIDYYLGNKLDEKHNTWGMVLGFEMGISNKKKNLKTELIIGLNFRKYQYSENITANKLVDSVINSVAFPMSPPTYNYIYTEDRTLFRYSGSIIEMPIYFKYNNKMRLLSPIMELGIKPYFIQEKAELVNYYSDKTNFKFASEFIIGVGIGLNYKKFNVKYVIYAEPLLKNSICIEYKLK
jgi:hypothetical protein